MVERQKNEKKNIIISINSVIIAVIPWLYIFKFPIGNANLGSFLIIISFAFGAFTTKKFEKATCIISFVFVYFLYVSIRSFSSLSSFLLPLLAGFCLLFIKNGAINKTTFEKTLVVVAAFNSALIVIQTICFYVLDKNLDFLSTNILVNQTYSSVYIGGLYRPHGLFLEPAHFCEYAILVLVFLLFGKSKYRSVLIALIVAGIVLTTSGIGIVLSSAVFLYYALFSARKLSVAIKRLFIFVMAFTILFFLLYQLSFFRNALARFLDFDNSSGYNAITGRTGSFLDVYLLLQKENSLFLGMRTEINYIPWLSGLTSVLMHFGILGLALLVLAFFLLFISTKSNASKCISIIFIGLLFVSNCTNVYYILVSVSLIYYEDLFFKSRLSLKNQHINGRTSNIALIIHS